jgi:putative ABC transport system permease protein
VASLSRNCACWAGVSALAPALRAARLRTVEAIAVGRTPRVGSGRRASRAAGRLPVPRALSLGLAAPFARRGRSLTIGAAVVFGAVGVTFAYGLGTSLSEIQRGVNRESPGQVAVHPLPPGGEQRPDGTVSGAAAPGSGPPPAPGGPDVLPGHTDPSAVGRTLAAQPGTAGWFSTARARVGVSGVAGSSDVTAYQGDSAWGAYQMVSGHWFSGPGQIVVARRFLDATGTRIGDTVTLTGTGGSTTGSTTVRIVGEALTTDDEGMAILTDAATLTRAGLTVPPDEFHVELDSGTDRTTYLSRLNAALAPLDAEASAVSTETSTTLVAMDAMIVMLTLMLITVAGLGVLNTVVLDTRERVHDLGVFKALGMAPRQTVVMVITSVAGIGAVAGLAGVPIGIALHGYVLPAMGDAAGTGIPAADLDVYHAPQLALLAAAGLVIAVGGAFLPATWAAATRTATALRTE